jgi:putative ABC transport system permease protein
MDASFMATNPHSFSMRINNYDAGMIADLTSLNGIKQVEARRNVRARAEIAPNVWRTSYLFVIEDFENTQIDTFKMVTGLRVPGPGNVLIEKSSLPVISKQIGEPVNWKISLNAPRKLTIAGIVHAPGLEPGWMEKTVYGFITQETLDLLGIPMENSDLLFVVSDEIRFDKNAIRETAFNLRDTLEAKGYKIDRITIPEPGKHPHGDQLSSLLFLFQVFGGLSLVLSGVLVINMISSMLSAQVRQIGIMKAAGARRGQIAGMYYGTVLVCGTAALILAVPFAAIVSRIFVNVCASMLNFSVSD